VNYRRRGGRGRLYGSAGEGTKALFHKGFSSFYALVTIFYTYPEPTPDLGRRAVTMPVPETGFSLTSVTGDRPMEVPIGRSYPRSLTTNYREPIGSNYRYHYRGATK
jgi:hypothetical protein